MKEWMAKCPLSEPELRLYLLEKGRKEGVGACRGAPRSERRGDEEHRVRTIDGVIVLTRERGRMAAAEATSILKNARRDLADAESMHKACGRSLEVEKLPEVVAEIKGRRDAHATAIKAMRAHIETIEEVPEPVLTEKRIRL